MRLSIVIPTLDEEKTLRPSLECALTFSRDVWVSDGGSRDATVEIARELGANVIVGAAGRGGQLNRGAAKTSGDVILFLHADTLLPPDVDQQLRSALADGIEAGGFHVRYDGDGDRQLSPLGNRLVQWRTSLSRWPLGDQAQFILRSSFDALGGFPDWPILEDLHFIRSLDRRRVRVLPGPVRTSSRRFARQGVARTVAVNWLIWGLYFAGVSPRRLAALYRNVR